MRPLILIIALLFCGQLSAEPVIEQLAGFTLGKSVDQALKRRAQQADPRNKLPDLLLLNNLPDYRRIAGCDVTLFSVNTEDGNISSIQITFKAPKGNRRSVFAWVKQETGVDPEPFEDGRLIYTKRIAKDQVRTLTLGSYVVGKEDLEYTVTISEQKVIVARPSNQ